MFLNSSRKRNGEISNPNIERTVESLTVAVLLLKKIILLPKALQRMQENKTKRKPAPVKTKSSLCPRY